jgi:S-adenosylmethionine uptake transporter
MIRDMLAERVAVRAALWMSAASLLVALSAACVRELSGNYSVLQLVFLRSVIGTTLLAPWMLRMGRRGTLRTTRLRLYLLRTTLSYSGMVCVFYGFAHMPIGEVYTLLFLVPLITVVLAVMILGERAGPQAWVACGIGFIGALVVLRHGIIAISLAAVADRANAFLPVGLGTCGDSRAKSRLGGYRIASPRGIKADQGRSK